MPEPATPWEARSGELDLLVFGHVNLDHFLDVRALPTPDRTVPITGRSTELGGTAANLARAAASFGVRVGIISRVGDDFPAAFRERLTAEHVDLTGLERVDGARTPSCFIVEDGRGGQFTLIDQGPMASANGARIPAERLRSCGWLHLGTGDPDYQLRLQAAARKAGVRVAVDPAQEIHYRWDARRFLRLVSGAEILFGNSAELDRGMEFLGVRTREQMLQHVPMVVETRGKRGATAFTRAGTVRVPAITPRKLGQVTGAGDAFRGGFYAAFFEGRPTRECLVAGTRSAARWIQFGSFRPSRGARE